MYSPQSQNHLFHLISASTHTVIDYKLTVHVQPHNYRCRTHAIHTYGISTSHFDFIGEVIHHLIQEITTTIQLIRVKNRLNHLQIYNSPWFFQLTNTAT